MSGDWRESSHEQDKTETVILPGKRGRIPEVAGKENVFDLDENFADNISSRIVYLLTHPEYKQSYDSVFSWKNSILSEVEVYKSIVHDHI